jgi:hypothetical protein
MTAISVTMSHVERALGLGLAVMDPRQSRQTASLAIRDVKFSADFQTISITCS